MLEVTNCDLQWKLRGFIRGADNLEVTNCDFKSGRIAPKWISDDDRKVPTMSAQLSVPPQKLIYSLSYSQFKLLVDLDEDLMRAFAAT